MRALVPTVCSALCVGLAACGDDAATRHAATIERPSDPRVATADAGGDAAPDVAPGDTVGDSLEDAASEDTSVEDVEVGPDADVASEVEAPDLTHPDPAWPPLSAEALAAIDTGMRAALDVPALAGRTFGGLVVDVDNDQVVWALDPDRLLIPASNTKVFTTAAAMDLLGEDHRMETTVSSSGALVDGVLAGDLDLYSEHDFTWSRWFYGDPREPAERLADALWRRGLRRVAGDVGVWGAYLYEGHHFGTYDPATQRARAGQAFLGALAARGIAVDGDLVDHATMEAPAGTALARWSSIPIHVGAWAINRRSHNEMADILVRHLGWREGGSSDYTTGGAVVAAWLAGTGAAATGFTVSDGSGLSLANRVSARHLVDVYRYMTKSPVGSRWISSLSIAGAGGPASVDGNDLAIVTTNVSPYMGTLAGRMTGADTAGRVFGKSGTNAGITTSGLLFNRHDGHRYAFAFLMNQLPSGTANTARVTQDALVAGVARRHAGRGERPGAVTLGCVRGRDDGLVEVHVSGPTPDPGDARAGFALETSADGRVWRRERALLSRTSPLVVAPLPGTLYVRARAESSGGIGDPSDAYPVRVRPGGPRVLLVDADDRWQRQPTNENPMGAAHTFMVAYGEAVPDPVAIDTCPNEAVTDGAVALAAYDAVVWAAGEEAATDESISALEATALADWLGLGGALFVSGAEIAWDLDPAGNALATAADRAFHRTWLGAEYAGDDAGVYVVEGAPGGIFADRVDARRLGFWTPGEIFVAYPDELAPLGEAAPCMTYLGPGSVACVQLQGEFALVSLGFPFESLDSAEDRADVMARALAFLGLALD
ncbi:MAG: D-alanyl-D-alanine carboxypeptidase [Deltaproteobacteria bacterium]|nr:D-alanyl-D-alanine carboxypeptidase [Deltaproteobacteria bacterium]